MSAQLESGREVCHKILTNVASVIHGQRDTLRLGLDSEFYAVEERLKAMGLVRHEGESLLDWHGRLKQREEVQPELLQVILNLHYRYRFDPIGFDENDRSLLKEQVRKWLEAIQPA
ncbi:MAG: hypothetical protein CMO80_01770 [Verrucomicrobiales bacterium]|nr:hypothetical protein [Verrucomicrobiales bacterium]|tara:strand:- start:4060 stop:4407 length:348 start_codon:yes stop_codon:yes gene_type:complete